MKTRNILFVLFGGAIIATIVMVSSMSCNQISRFYGNADELVADLSKHLVSITVDELKKKYDEGEMFYLLDVRELQEHAYGFIPGSVHVCGGVLPFRIGSDEFWEQEMLYTPLPEDEIVVYCKKGKRSVLAADNLKKLGYSNVKYLEGGWKKWELTFPLEYDKKLDILGGQHEEEGEAGGC